MAGTIARAAQVGDDDLGAAPRQFDRIGAAQPAARTGHDGHTPVEIARHDELPKIATHWGSHETRHVLNRSPRAGKGGKKLHLSSNCHAKDMQLSSTGHNSAARLSHYAKEPFIMRNYPNRK